MSRSASTSARVAPPRDGSILSSSWNAHPRSLPDFDRFAVEIALDAHAA